MRKGSVSGITGSDIVASKTRTDARASREMMPRARCGERRYGSTRRMTAAEICGEELPSIPASGAAEKLKIGRTTAPIRHRFTAPIIAADGCFILAFRNFICRCVGAAIVRATASSYSRSYTPIGWPITKSPSKNLNCRKFPRESPKNLTHKTCGR